jgi:RES domain-containing protein
MTVSLWRIASDTPSYTAEDMAGKGAASAGARWNNAGEHVTYAATSISLAAWETRAHFSKGTMLPWNRILVRIDVPDVVWSARIVTPRPLPVGWNIVPEGMISRSIGSAWLASYASALLVVPSVIINEEDNVLINPAHPDAALITTDRVRQFVYDHRV